MTAKNGGGIAMHVCCAPCLAGALATARAEPDAAPVPDKIFFYNPNIHPLLEFRRRRKALQVYLERDPFEAEIVGEYGLVDYLAAILDGGMPPDRRERCRRCYLLRFNRVAAEAAKQGFGAFTSTLLASREQDRDLVAEAGKEAAARHGIRFVPGDFRRRAPDDRMMRGIYKQQYCGCIFSEEERYRDTKKHLYKGDDSDE